jgi:[ribosomal protein S5]-alanine N-acetyltransferase
MSLVLQTERLTLKPFAESDLDVVERIFVNKFVRRYLFDDEIIERGQIEEFINISNQTFSKKKYGLWLIVLNESQVIIGVTGLWHFFEEQQPQLLYALLPEYAGEGFATEAARKIVEYSFSELDFEHLDASCDAPNFDSQKVAQRLGMKKIREESINESPTVFFRLEK